MFLRCFFGLPTPCGAEPSTPDRSWAPRRGKNIWNFSESVESIDPIALIDGRRDSVAVFRLLPCLSASARGTAENFSTFRSFVRLTSPSFDWFGWWKIAWLNDSLPRTRERKANGQTPYAHLAVFLLSLMKQIWRAGGPVKNYQKNKLTKKQ